MRWKELIREKSVSLCELLTQGADVSDGLFVRELLQRDEISLSQMRGEPGCIFTVLFQEQWGSEWEVMAAGAITLHHLQTHSRTPLAPTYVCVKQSAQHQPSLGTSVSDTAAVLLPKPLNLWRSYKGTVSHFFSISGNPPLWMRSEEAISEEG